MLGSDYPFPLGEHHPGKMIEAIEDMEQETKVCLGNVKCAQIVFVQEQLLAGNALEFLGLDPAKYISS